MEKSILTLVETKNRSIPIAIGIVTVLFFNETRLLRERAGIGAKDLLAAHKIP